MSQSKPRTTDEPSRRTVPRSAVGNGERAAKSPELKTSRPKTAAETAEFSGAGRAPSDQLGATKKGKVTAARQQARAQPEGRCAPPRLGAKSQGTGILGWPSGPGLTRDNLKADAQVRLGGNHCFRNRIPGPDSDPSRRMD
jgi:hypothetical protein